MFTIDKTILNPENLKKQLRLPAAGACVTFEGWVRNINEGSAIRRMEYEAYEEVALAEGRKVIKEALEKFDIHEASCAHRVGKLEIGELAVWIGVSSMHRSESFRACSYIIDEIKQRLPIWKKEFYLDGDSGWVNCETSPKNIPIPHSTTIPSPSTKSSLSEDTYYDRQLRLKMVGSQGQQKLRDSRVLVIGAGGLGSPVLLYLAAAGVGQLGVCEGDFLEASNLHRQVIFSHEDIGRPKSVLASERLKKLNPFVKIETIEVDFMVDNAIDLFSGYTLVLDCTDNFATKFLINDAAVLSKTPALFASIYQYEGQIQLYDPAVPTACLRCLWPQTPEQGCVGNCAEVGVLGAVPGVFGTMQAMEALKYLLELPGVLASEMFILDTLTLTSFRITNRKSSACPICSDSPSITAIEASNYGSSSDLEIELDLLTEEELQEFEIIDVRNPATSKSQPITQIPNVQIPYFALEADDNGLTKDKKYLLCCDQGVSSILLTEKLRARGFHKVFSLRGGYETLKHS